MPFDALKGLQKALRLKEYEHEKKYKGDLSEEKIAIRAGHHCAQPLQQYLQINASARASLYFYNTEAEIDVFLDKLSQLRKWSGYKD